MNKTYKQLEEEMVKEIVPLFRDVQYGDSRDNIEWREKVGEAFANTLRRVLRRLAEEATEAMVVEEEECGREGQEEACAAYSKMCFHDGHNSARAEMLKKREEYLADNKEL